MKNHILAYNILYKILIATKHCVLGSVKQNDLLKFMMELDI